MTALRWSSAWSSTGPADEVVDTIEAAGGKAWAIRADLVDLADPRRLFEEAGRRLGALDLLVNMAGSRR